MRNSIPDLTRHDGAGASIAARLPSAPDERPAAAAALIDRAVTRWALRTFSDRLHTTAGQMLIDQRDVEPIDMCVRITPTTVTLVIGAQDLIVSLITQPAFSAA